MTTSVLDMIAPADVQAIADTAKHDALAFVEANKIGVVDVGTLQCAVAVRTAIGDRKSEILAKLAGPKSWAYKLHRWFCDLEAAALAPYDQLDKFESAQISAFKAEQDRLRQAHERELADQRRREDEARAAIEAAALETAGEHEMAAAVVAEAIAAPPAVVALPDVTKGVAKFTRRWHWRFTGGPKEIKQTPPDVLARTLKMIPREFLCVDEQKVGAYVRSMKASGKIPGVEIYYTDDPVR